MALLMVAVCLLTLVTLIHLRMTSAAARRLHERCRCPSIPPTKTGVGGLAFGGGRSGRPDGGGTVRRPGVTLRA